MSTPPVVASAKITPPVFFGIQWMFAGLAGILLGFRLYVRISSYHRLYSDDALVIAAWIFFLANNILWHTQLGTIYELVDFQNGLSFSLELIDKSTALLKTIIAFNFLFNCCLWAVKLSFLLFFRRLGERSQDRPVRIWWWVVTLITVGAWAVSVGDFEYKCALGDLGYIYTYCQSAEGKAAQARDTRINTSMDLITDGLIITIPVIMLWNTHIPTRKKLGLLGIFSLTILTMVFALIRLLVLPSAEIASDQTWSFMWSNIEMGVAIIVACLGSFRQLYVNKQEKERKGYVKSGSQQSRPRGRWGFFSAIRSAFTRGSSDSGSKRGILLSMLSFGSSRRSRQQAASYPSTDPSSMRAVRHNVTQNTASNIDASEAWGTSDNNSGRWGTQYSQATTAKDGANGTLTSGWSMNRSRFVDRTQNDSVSNNVDEQNYPLQVERMDRDIESGSVSGPSAMSEDGYERTGGLQAQYGHVVQRPDQVARPRGGSDARGHAL